MPGPKTARSKGDLLKLFPTQEGDLDCLPTCIRGVLSEFAERQGLTLRIPPRQVEKACGYVDGEGSAIDAPTTKALLDTRLRKADVESAFDFGPAFNLERLNAVLADPKASLPIVGLHGGYFFDPAVPRPSGDPTGFSHAVILVGLSHPTATLYDPLLRAVHGDKASDKYFLDLPLVRFEKHWQSHDPPNWTYWIRQLGKPTIRKLTDYEAR